MPNYTNNLNLEKPLQSENYNIDIFNSNADKIDSAIQEVKGKVDGLDLKAEKVTLADKSNLFNATNVEDALLENKTSIQNANSNISKLQSSVSANKTNISNLQSSVSTIQGNVSNLQSNVSSLQSEINGQRLKAIQINNELEDIL